MNEQKTKLIGKVGVDSGTLIVCDPCYLDSSWKKTKKDADIFNPNKRGEFSYAGCCQATLQDKEQGGQLNIDTGGAFAGVAFTTGFGDGVYPIYAVVKDYGKKGRPDWRVKEVVIKFIED